MIEHDVYLPNNGRTKLVPRPVDIDHLYPDPDRDLPILLIATRSPPPIGTNPKPTPRDTHWKLAWDVGTNTAGIQVQRQIHLIRDLGVEHLTNWGAVTKTSEGYTKAIEVIVMSFNNRQRLERIALETPVRKPNGKWNCQDWLITVFEESEKQGLFTHEQWVSAIAAISDI